MSTRICSAEGCTRKHHARGLCNPCYGARRSIPSRLGPYLHRPSLTERMELYTNKSGGDDGCWPWVGTVRANGYGHIRVGHKMVPAHRVAYELAFGRIPYCEGHHGMCVCHRCDNPSCVNPRHLFLGDHKANMADKVAKSRQQRLGGSANGRAKIDWEDVASIRSMYAAGGMSYGKLSTRFGLSKSQIGEIVREESWKDDFCHERLWLAAKRTEAQAGQGGE